LKKVEIIAYALKRRLIRILLITIIIIWLIISRWRLCDDDDDDDDGGDYDDYDEECVIVDVKFITNYLKINLCSD